VFESLDLFSTCDSHDENELVHLREHIFTREVLFVSVGSDKETGMGEEEDAEPGVRRKKKKKIRTPGRCCHLYCFVGGTTQMFRPKALITLVGNGSWCCNVSCCVVVLAVIQC